MTYDIFFSYSRRDNERGQVTALKAQIETSFHSFAGRKLNVFLDTHPENGIKGMDDWRQKIQRCLRESHLFLAVLSPNYLASPYCRWEWEDYVRYEAMRQCLGEGVAPVFFVTLPDAGTQQADQAIARWIDEINHRQTFDLRPWHDHGEQALQEAHVKSTLEQLQASVRERLDRAERARRSPNNLIKHNPAFVGRIRELTQLRNVLTRNKLGVVGARQGRNIGQVTVQGLGGMGKTELALAYAHAFAWDYPGGRWQIPCEHTGDLRLALSRLAGPMQFEFTEDEKKDLTLQFERVLRELQRRDRCLLILDNVSDPHLLEPEYLDRLPRDGHVDLIATTRLAPTAIPGSAQDSTFIAVDELPEEDALALMRSHQSEGRFASQDEDNEARQIVRLLRGFTLAVETAAIYLGRHPAPDVCRQFREHLSPDLFRESEQAATDPTVAVRHRVRSLDETLAFTLQTLTPEARHLLTFAALLPAEQVAVPWLRALGAERYPAFQNETGPAFRLPLDQLLGLRLFQPGEELDTKGDLLIVRMHRLIQDLMRQKTTAADLGSRQQAVDLLVKNRDEALRHMTRWIETRWELAALTALAWQWDKANHADASWLLNRMGICWYGLGVWNEAESLYRRCYFLDEHNYGTESVNSALSAHNLAQLLHATNRITEAELLYRKAMGLWAVNLGTNNPLVATAAINLAELLRDTGRIEEAARLQARALAINKATWGDDGVEVATNLNNLAASYCAMGRLSDAEPLHRRALAIYESKLGIDHPHVAKSLNTLAELLRASKRYEEAETLYRRGLSIAERSLGPTHHQVAIHLNDLANLLYDTDRYEEAENLYRRALAIHESVYGHDHPQVAIRLNNLANLLFATKGYEEAESVSRRSLLILFRFTQTTRQRHPDLAKVVFSYSVIFEAYEHSRQSLMKRLFSSGAKSPALGNRLQELGQEAGLDSETMNGIIRDFFVTEA